jgi:hypothetical protein
VKVHVGRILDAMGVRTRRQAVLLVHGTDLNNETPGAISGNDLMLR